RWPTLLKFLKQCERYWRATVPKQTLITVPANYDRKAELTTVVWLHGMGAEPSSMRDVFQELADQHQVGFVSVSGTIASGRSRFAWADQIEDDFERIRQALSEAKDKLRIRPGTAIALGFSQGGVVAVEVAARHPEVFAGAILVSAGTGSPLQLEAVADKSVVKQQGYVVICGAKEAQASIHRADELTAWLRRNGAQVLRPNYPNHSAHGFPDDFEKRFPEWVKFIHRAKSR